MLSPMDLNELFFLRERELVSSHDKRQTNAPTPTRRTRTVGEERDHSSAGQRHGCVYGTLSVK